MSLPAMTSGDRFCFSRKGGIGRGGWVYLKGADSMAVSGLCFEDALVGSECPPMHKWVEKTVLLPCMAPISDEEAFIPVWASGCQLSAVTVASSLMGGGGLSHKCVEDGSKSTWVEFGG